MNPPQRTRVQVTRSDSGVRITVPPAMPPRAAPWAIPLLLLFAFAFPAFVFMMTSEIPTKVRLIFAGMATVVPVPAMLALIARLTRSWQLERTGSELIVTKKGLLGTRTRRWPWAQIRSITTVQSGRRGSGEYARDVPLYELRIGLDGSKTAKVLRGSDDEHELLWIAWNLMTLNPPPTPVPAPPRVDYRPGKPADSRATVESTADRVRITLPPMGVFKSQPNGALVGALVLPVFSLFAGGALIFFRSKLGGIWQIGLAALILFVVVGTLFTLVEVNRRCRRGTVEADRQQLRITWTGLLGSDSREWRWDQIQRVEGGFTGTTINEAPQMALLVTLKSGTVFKGFAGRDRAELDWIAGEVIRLSRPEPVAVESTLQAPGGQCQICGAEMKDRRVFCARCRTPHHEDCWRYTGQCSTYGCREIRFVKE